MKARLLVTAVLAFASTPAHAFDIGVLGGFQTNNVSQTGGVITFNSDLTPSFGAFVKGGLAPGFSLELDVLYSQTKYTSPDLNGGTDVSFHSWQFPLLVRFTALPLVSFGAGIQFEKATGQLTIASGGVSQDVDFASNDFGTTNWSLPLVAGFHLPLAPAIDFLVDLRYLIGLTNLETNGSGNSSTKISHFQALAGVSLSL
jgi:hypothetical protein